MTDLERLRRKLLKTMLTTVVEHRLLEEGDRVLVAISGGKDSYTLFDLLRMARERAPVSFELLAFHLDQGQPGHDTGRLRAWLEASGVPYRIHREDTYSLVLEKSAGDAATYCAPCSRFRRGILYTWAERLGCNKIALGHHRDDALETLLLNLFYAGRLQAMPAHYRSIDDRFDVIRPLVECGEREIEEHAALSGYPILPCNLCGSQRDLKRARVATLLESLEQEIPDVRRVMLGALRNVRPTHLLDREVAEAWESAAHRFAPRK